MKLLVLAQVPPPHHGQSAMVQQLLDELPKAAPEIELHHVNLALSHDSADIGRWRGGKLLAARRILREAHAVISRHGCDALYYVPAPGKRIALWRDLLLLRSLRRRVPRLILHWHASGLGFWLDEYAWKWEQRAAQRALGGATLSIGLAPSLLDDVALLKPQATAAVPNGIPDPLGGEPVPSRQAKSADDPVRILFLGTGIEDKGLFTTIDTLAHLPQTHRVVFAGSLPDAADTERFAEAQTRWGERLEHTGFVDAKTRARLLREVDVLAFPTLYEHEAFPLVLIEALAADLPIVTTPWRAIPDLLPEGFPGYVPAGEPEILAGALQAAVAFPPQGRHRVYYEKHYTVVRWGERMAEALREVV